MRIIAVGDPHALRKHFGHVNGAAMQRVENDETVFHPSHSRLEDADEARVSHISATMATRLDKKDKAAAVSLKTEGKTLCYRFLTPRATTSSPSIQGEVQ